MREPAADLETTKIVAGIRVMKGILSTCGAFTSQKMHETLPVVRLHYSVPCTGPDGEDEEGQVLAPLGHVERI